MKNAHVSLFLLLFLLAACDLGPTIPPSEKEDEKEEPVDAGSFVRGADLSYVNEMVDCGAVYQDLNGQTNDPYAIFEEAGADIVRVRLWHDATWTAYSDFEDVKQTIQAAQDKGMQVLLDFHYSDNWADPGKQDVPAAWLGVVDNLPALGDSLYNYTYQVLQHLDQAGLLPEMVQVGNEINIEILQDPNQSYGQINWNRNAALIQRGLAAVRKAEQDFGQEIAVMLHIAQPENALWWFEQATQNGITDYDWIGLSYYPIWSTYSLTNLSTAVATLKDTYKKRVMVVETAYPYTLEDTDSANNILGSDALVPGYPATQEGQYLFLKALEEALLEGGAEGLIYWEPAWVSTSCSTQWAQGSHWDNATLFDHSKQATTGMQYFSGE
ncbi:MAG: glycosyl hydrolase 53 family protein [Bacteroidota bacterium]